MSHTVRLAVAVCALAVLSPLVASAAAQNGSPHVLVATTGNQSELRKAVPITKRSDRKQRVVMSLGPELLPSLSSGDRLQGTGEVEVTTDCVEPDARCVGKPYTFNPIVQVRLVLANAEGVTGGTGALDLGAQRLKCRQKPPDREHHCVIVFTEAILDVVDRSQLPCAAGACYLNMVVDAHNRRAKKKGYKLLVGEDEPDGTVVADKGRLNAIRFAPGDQPEIPPQVTGTPLTTSLPIRKGDDMVVFSQELTGLERNDQLSVVAGLTTSIEDIPYNVLNRSRLILAPEPTATAPGKDVKDLTEPKGEIAEANGFNCTQRQPICPTNKVGVITMRKDAENDAGEPIPLYANLVASTAKPGVTAPAGDAVQILGGGLSVTVFPSDLKG